MISATATHVLILDRDGVINEDSDTYIKSIDEWQPIPGSIDAIARLSHAGYRIAVATNQSGVARGLLSLSDLLAMHQMLRNLVAEQGGRIDMIAFCPHGPEDHCRCRKPLSGLLEEIAERLNIDLKGIPCVGDSLRDLESARRTGATPLLVKTGKGARTLDYIKEQHDVPWLQKIPIYQDLSAVVDDLLQSRD